MSHIRFATSKIGYLCGPSLFMTVDAARAGSSCPALPSSPEAAEGGIPRRVMTRGCPGPRNRTVEEAPAGSDFGGRGRFPRGPAAGTSWTPPAASPPGARTIYLPIDGKAAGGGDAAATLSAPSTVVRPGRSWHPCGGPHSSGQRRDQLRGRVRRAADRPLLPAGRAAGVGGHHLGRRRSSWAPGWTDPGSALDLELIAAPGPGTLVVGSPMTTGSGLVTSTPPVSTDGGEEWLHRRHRPDRPRLGPARCQPLARFRGTRPPVAGWATTRRSGPPRTVG